MVVWRIYDFSGRIGVFLLVGEVSSLALSLVFGVRFRVLLSNQLYTSSVESNERGYPKYCYKIIVHVEHSGYSLHTQAETAFLTKPATSFRSAGLPSRAPPGAKRALRTCPISIFLPASFIADISFAIIASTSSTLKVLT